MVKILMHGCNGKMGRVISNLALDNDNCEIVAGVDPNLKTSHNYPIFSSIEDCNVYYDVIIDFSTATAVPAMLDCATKNNKPVVLCTTGLSPETIDLVKEKSSIIPIFYSANMSLGINLISNLIKRAAEVLYDSNFDIEIIEKHHNQKIDAPSGTALYLADSINETMDNKYTYKYDRSNVKEKREKNEIGMHCIRGGTIVGEHEIIFAGNDEIISLKHTAMSKDIFATGSLKAAMYIVNKDPGLYNMENMISE